MNYHLGLRAGFLACAVLALASCQTGTSGQGSGFKSQYLAARQALEAGKYDQASRAYAQLLTRAGPLEPRIRLEYAHTLLRKGDYEGAAREGHLLAQTPEADLRHAALAVSATADHELGLAAIQNGDLAKGKQLLTQADAAITQVLQFDAKLDPLGALAGRQRSIRLMLKGMA